MEELIQQADGRLTAARWVRGGLFAAGLFFCTFVATTADAMHQHNRRGEEARAAAIGGAVSTAPSPASGLFWFGMALIGFSFLVGIEVAIREGDRKRFDQVRDN